MSSRHNFVEDEYSIWQNYHHVIYKIESFTKNLFCKSRLAKEQLRIIVFLKTEMSDR